MAARQKSNTSIDPAQGDKSLAFDYPRCSLRNITRRCVERKYKVGKYVYVIVACPVPRHARKHFPPFPGPTILPPDTPSTVTCQRDNR